MGRGRLIKTEVNIQGNSPEASSVNRALTSINSKTGRLMMSSISKSEQEGSKRHLEKQTTLLAKIKTAW